MDIITFCASHISTRSRIPLLQNAIQSIIDQKYKVCMFVSISCDNEIFQKELHDMIVSQYAMHISVKIYVHLGKLSQFEHYNYLLNQIDPLFYNRTWVMFMDDDDFSHPLRSSWFHTYTKDRERTCKSICNPYLLVFQNPDNDIPTYSSCMERLLTGKSKTRAISCREYVVYCIRLNILNQFIHTMQQHKLLHTPLCDVVLSSVLHNITKNSDWTVDASWAYAYNIHNGTDRLTSKYSMKYYKTTYTKNLYQDLGKQFQFEQWDVAPGYSPLWDKQLYQKCNGIFGRLMLLFMKT